MIGGFGFVKRKREKGRRRFANITPFSNLKWQELGTTYTFETSYVNEQVSFTVFILPEFVKFHRLNYYF